MDKYLNMIPKGWLAVLAVFGGTVFIILADPPKSVCTSQINVIKEAQKRFLFLDPKKKLIKTTKFETLRDQCRMSNNTGGCSELFSLTREFLHDLSTLSRECAPAAAKVKEFDRALWETLNLMVRLAWGEAPPTAYNAKFNWLDTADINLYCKLKARIQITFGEPKWNTFREKMMKELPGAKDIPRNQAWDMTIFSENCARYP